METNIILSWLILNKENCVSEPIIDESEFEINIYVEIKREAELECPKCHSNKIGIKEKVLRRTNASGMLRSSKPIYVNIIKRRYECKICGKTFTQKETISEKKKKVSNDLRWDIMYDLQKPVTFKFVAEKFHLSDKTVMNIFDEMVFLKKIQLSETLAIDEKRFTTDQGKYICAISNATKGNIIDVLPSRTLDYLADYFRKFPASEREKVKYVTSDMNITYRRIIRAFFPKAYHIIDHFHVTKLFTDAITKVRCFEMKKYDQNKKCKMYRILKNKWKLFLINPFTEKGKAVMNKTYFDEDGVLTDNEETIEWALARCPDLFKIHLAYLDYLQYIKYGMKIEEVETMINFLINKLTNTKIEIIAKVGRTLSVFKEELIITFSELNESHLSNARAEAANNNMGTLIKMAYGYKNFDRFRKRVLWIEQKTEVF